MLDATEHWQLPEHEIEEYAPKSKRYCICIFVLNEIGRLHAQLQAMQPLTELVDIVIADGGSTDGSIDAAQFRTLGVRTLLVKRGPGGLAAQQRMAFAYALRQGYEGVVIADGNNKDDIAYSLPRMIEKLEEGFDHVQGSRFIEGGRHENTPLMRHLGLKLVHAPLISLAAGFDYTDTTNGFRAYSNRLLNDSGIQVFRDVFKGYELHYYLAIEAARRGFRVCEVPAIRRYPKGEAVPTKISPIKGNLKILATLAAVIAGKFAPPRPRSRPWPLDGWLAFMGFVFMVCLNLPGYLYPDSTMQLAFAKVIAGLQTGIRIYDYHPIEMSLLWTLFVRFHNPTTAMLVLNQLMFWSGLWLFFRAVFPQRMMLRCLLLLLAGFYPPLMGTYGAVLKDLSDLSALTLFVGLVLKVRQGKFLQSGRSPLLLLLRGLLFAALFFYAINVRKNGVFIMLPLVLLFDPSLMSARPGMAVQWPRRLVSFGAAVILSLVLHQVLTYRIVGATRGFQIQQLYLHDLCGISIRQGRNLLPEGFVQPGDVGLARIERIYDPGDVVPMLGLGKPEDLIKMTDDPARISELRGQWLRMILRHPVSYIAHRSALAASLFGIGPHPVRYPVFRGPSEGDVDSGVRFADWHRRIFDRLEGISQSLIYRGYVYVLAAVLLVIFWWFRRARYSFSMVSPGIALSGLMNSVPLFFIGLGSDFRYHLWSILACLLALACLLGEWLAHLDWHQPGKD